MPSKSVSKLSVASKGNASSSPVSVNDMLYTVYVIDSGAISGDVRAPPLTISGTPKKAPLPDRVNSEEASS